MRTLADLGPSKLLPAEQEQLRETAEALFFCESSDDRHAIDALTAAVEHVRHLVGSDRWTQERGAELVADLEACGPAALVA